MQRHFVSAPFKQVVLDIDLFADKSALILEWLLVTGVKKKTFALREVARRTCVSVGLVQRVFEKLLYEGLLSSDGVRTSKQYRVKAADQILKQWLDYYQLLKKCRVWTYNTGLGSSKEALAALAKSPLRKKVCLALHSAAKAHHLKNTNLDTVELYLIDQNARVAIEKALRLEHRERGYEILLIKPYYKSMLFREMAQKHSKELAVSPLLLTFLDLNHYPLRGKEQAHHIVTRMSFLKHSLQKIR